MHNIYNHGLSLYIYTSAINKAENKDKVGMDGEKMDV